MSTIQINMHEAKTKLSHLAEKVWAGDKVVIAKSGKPYLDLLPHQPQKQRVAGHYKGKIKLAKNFDETPLDVIEDFEGLL
ncbi:MAG: type II toxin-antitoxin system prevent-host-death family antitoxin [Ghiorsea sp.]|nr:type II toxin-antitoxin system prevent-host-death family antitoxin [Ghiorsea sp.]